MDQHIKNLLRGDRGHFAAQLAQAYQVADSGNRARLLATWPKVFTPPTETRTVVARIVYTAKARVHPFDIADLIANALCNECFGPDVSYTVKAEEEL